MQRLSILLKIFLIILINTFFLSAQDLRNINVDNLTDDQVKKLIARAQSSGLTQQQLEAAALARGLSPTELEKLRKRIEKINSGVSTDKTQIQTGEDRLRQYNRADYLQQLEKRQKDSLFIEILADKLATADTMPKKNIFGSYLFSSTNLTFEPSLNIPTPQNYQIGPGDEIVIDIWGASQQNYKLVVNPEGYIFIDNVGPVYVNGLTIEKASKQIIGRLSSIYSGLLGSNPNTFAQVNLGQLRSIRVNMVGELTMPGTYTLPSLASVFNALYVAGGPSENGSYRNIVVIRENKEIAKIDLYDFLINGDQKSNIRLQDQDVILVKPYAKRVELKGEVKTPAFFELKENETMADLLKYTGGFTDKAYQHRIKIVRKTDKELSVAEVTNDKFSTFVLENGDEITVEPILNRFKNRVEILGAVYRPGIYELTNGLTLKQLIEKAEGLREDAFTERAIIYRLRPDMSIETLPVSISSIFTNSTNDLLLQREDVIKIFSIFDLEEKYDLQIQGEVQLPGKYPYLKNMTLSDLIATAGGFKESASLARIEVARRVKNSDYRSTSAQIAEIKLFNVSKNLTISDSASNFVLEPYDQVFVRRSPGYEVQTYATVAGEVLFPGTYTIESKSERISDLIKRAGGLTPEAYPRGAKFFRQSKENLEFRAKILKAVEEVAMEDSAKLATTLDREQSIGINLEEILSNPGSKNDLLLQDGDRLEIPKRLETVRLSGALLYPVTVRYEEGKSLKSYIKAAGGLSPNALPRKTFVIYANGSVKTATNVLGIKFYPRIEPGAEIIVPKKIEKQKMSTQELIAISTGITSLSLLIVTLISKF